MLPAKAPEVRSTRSAASLSVSAFSMPRRWLAASTAAATAGPNDLRRAVSAASDRRSTGRARLPLGKVAAPSANSAASCADVSPPTPRSLCNATTNGVRAYSTLSIASLSISAGLGGRLLTASSICPAISALMPPLLPRAGSTSTFSAGLACMKACASSRMPPVPLPVPVTRTTLWAKAPVVSHASAQHSATRRVLWKRGWDDMQGLRHRTGGWRGPIAASDSGRYGMSVRWTCRDARPAGHRRSPEQGRFQAVLRSACGAPAASRVRIEAIAASRSARSSGLVT